MNKIETKTVYIVVEGKDKATGSYDPIDINENSCWLEKNENMIVLTKQEFEKTIGDAFDMGAVNYGAILQYLERGITNDSVNKQTYITQLFKSKL